MSQPAPGMEPGGTSATSQLLLVLSNETRLDILVELARSARCVTDLAQELELDASSVSQALRKLQAARLVAYQIDKKQHVYRLTDAVEATVNDRDIEIRVLTNSVDIFIRRATR